MNFKKLINKKLHIFLHAIAWLILFIIPAYLLEDDKEHDTYFMAHVYLQTFLFALIFYLNYFWLLPQLFFRNKRWLYFLAAPILIIIMSVSIELIHDEFLSPKMDEMQLKEKSDNQFENAHMHKPSKKWPVYNFLLTSFLMTGFSMGLVFSEKLILNEKLRKEAEKEKLNSELTLLKNQISPHFFFNTLNNIYALAKINSDDTQNAILRLSRLMRYLLYESEQGNTMLSREIEFMNNYIDLNKLRLNDKVKLTVSFPQDFKDVEIPPLLFIPFIENAFKHGISYRDYSFINISMSINAGIVNFQCKNSIISKTRQSVIADKGIGLSNINKRLNLLYPDNHILTINKTDETFEVNLEINLKSLKS